MENAALDDGLEFQLGEVALRFRVEVAPPAPRAPAPSDPGEIVLEGEWSRAPPNAAPLPERELERTASTRSPLPETIRARPPAPPIAPSGAPRAGLAVRAPVAGKGGAAASRAVLQYQRVADAGGAFNTDLAQQPWWIKLLLAIVALALFAGIFWLAFRCAAFFKGQVAAPVEDGATVETR
jgi:hypothetical protein